MVEQHEFGDEHRLFLQAIISRRFLEEEELKQCQKDAYQLAGEDPSPLVEFLRRVNEALREIDLELKRAKDNDGNYYYALVNTRRDGISELATGYEDHEISFFKHLLELLVDAPDESYEAGSLKILNDLKRVNFTGRKKMTEKDCEEFLTRLVADHWIVEPTKGRYHLSVRSILELKPYLVENFDEIAQCEACKEIIATKRLPINGRTCPGCGKAWAGDWRGRNGAERITKVRQGGERRREEVDDDEADGMEEDDEDEEEEEEEADQ
ncbi:hypothetical protein HDU93_001923 [Gonapodya sp. JEL0774]|nr:hypothetical protein HDU93_001923 [Gonapodya sp. JEL0774]